MQVLRRGEMLKDGTENDTIDRSLQCNMTIGKKDQRYLEVPAERHNALHSHSLLLLDSGECTYGRWVCFLILSSPGKPQSCKAIPKSSK